LKSQFEFKDNNIKSGEDLMMTQRKKSLPPPYEDFIRRSQTLYSNLLSSLQQENHSFGPQTAIQPRDDQKLILKSSTTTIKILWEPKIAVDRGIFEKLWNTGETNWKSMILEVVHQINSPKEYSIETYALPWRRRSSGINNSTNHNKNREAFVKFSLRDATIELAKNVYQHQHVFQVTSVSDCRFLVSVANNRELEDWLNLIKKCIFDSK
jgi:hypothetical protein